MKLAIYTCIFDDYDFAFPPLVSEAGVSYIIITENPDIKVDGWITEVVDIAPFEDGKSANHYYRSLFHRIFTEFDYSLYVDGNIRLLGNTLEFCADFMASNKALGLFPHPIRTSVADEVTECLAKNKINNTERLAQELEFQRQEGFTDDFGLIEATILLKNHNHPQLDAAMWLWWELFERFGTRNQLSLPYVLWKTSAEYMLLPHIFRQKNPYFGLYTHRKDKRAPKHYAYIDGRAYDSSFFSLILTVWHKYWALRRFFRKRGLKSTKNI